MKSVLIVEDDVILCQMYSDKFEVGEYAVLTSKDGEEGLKIAMERKPDLIVADVGELGERIEKAAR